jgi:4-hydroxybenzoate polyprenyltransferase
MRATTPAAYLQLVRPPNVVTAAADVLAGYAAAGQPDPWMVPALVFSGMALYAGGVVFNDVFDRELDARERPERPIPSGRVQAAHAAAAGTACLVAGVASAGWVSAPSGAIAAAIACCAVLYDSWAKHRAMLGPAVMGLCRGGSLLLGLSAAPATGAHLWYLALLPITYVAGVTVVSRGEVTGGSRQLVLLGSLLISSVGVAILLLGRVAPFEWWWAAIPLLFLGYRVAPNLWRAFRVPSAMNIRLAVRAGVLSIVVLDATIAAGFGGPWYGAGVLILLGLAACLARPFAVT